MIDRPITIVGAGLGGLTLARILHLNGVPAIVYDGEASATARTQGGMLDIHEESGQAALRAAGLFDQFQNIIQPGGEATRILDKTGTVLYDEAPGDSSGTRPEVDRGDLRRILLDSVPAEMIQWGAKVTAVRALETGGFELTINDTTTVVAETLIGADGAWSKVRPLLSDAIPEYLGVSYVEAHIVNAAANHPKSASVVGRGSLFALSDEKGFLAHLHPNGQITAYAALKAAEGWSSSGEIDFKNIGEAKVNLLEHFTDWDEGLRTLITDSKGEVLPKAIYALPVDHSWERRRGVTLLGDAAHLMSPFAGEGANLAMLDAMELAVAIADQPNDLEAAFANYEKALFPRSETAAAESAANMAECFMPGAAQRLVRLMTQHRPGD